MSFFDRMNKAPVQDCTQAPPTQGVRRFLFLLCNHFWKLVALNAMFMLFSLPLVTLPAALCGMYRVCVKLVREGHCFLWQDFWEEFTSQLFKSLPAGILYGLALMAGWYFVGLSLSNGGMFGAVCGAIGVLLWLLAVVVGGYTFVMLSMLRLSSGQILRNGMALAALECKNNLVLAGISFLWTAFALLLYPYSILAMPVFFFTSYALAVTITVHEAVQKHIVAPFEAAQAAEADAAANAAAVVAAFAADAAAAANAAAAGAAAAQAAAGAAARRGPGV